MKNNNLNSKLESFEELKFLSIDRLTTLLQCNLQLLEHYIQNELYCKQDYLNTIKDIYVINRVITYKYKKYEKKYN